MLESKFSSSSAQITTVVISSSTSVQMLKLFKCRKSRHQILITRYRCVCLGLSGGGAGGYWRVIERLCQLIDEERYLAADGLAAKCCMKGGAFTSRPTACELNVEGDVILGTHGTNAPPCYCIAPPIKVLRVDRLRVP